MSEPSSASRVAGQSFYEVTINGTTYVLSEPQRYCNIADEEMVIVAVTRNDPLEFGLRACSVTSPTMHAAIWAGCSLTASRRVPTAEEKAAYEIGPWKWAFMFWKTLSPSSPQKKGKDLRDPAVIVNGVRWAYEIVAPLAKDDATFNRLMYAIGQASQDEDLKNWFGPRVDSGTQQTETPSTADTPESTPTSETATA